MQEAHDDKEYGGRRRRRSVVVDAGYVGACGTPTSLSLSIITPFFLVAEALEERLAAFEEAAASAEKETKACVRTSFRASIIRHF